MSFLRLETRVLYVLECCQIIFPGMRHAASIPFHIFRFSEREVTGLGDTGSYPRSIEDFEKK